MVEGAVRGRRITRRSLWYGAFIGLVLVAPFLTMLNVATASDGRPHPGCSHIVGDIVANPTFAVPRIYNVNVTTSSDPQFQVGSSVQIAAYDYEPGADEIEVGRRLGFAITSYRMHDPTTGNTTFQGWRLCDTKAGALWATQETALGQGALATLAYVGAGAWLAFALDPQRRVDGRVRLAALVFAIACGVFLAVYTSAVMSHGPTPLFPTTSDDGLVASALGFGLFFLLLASAVASALLLRPVGTASLVISGASVLTLSWAQLVVSFHIPNAVVADPYVAALFAAAAVAGISAHRALPRWLPSIFASMLCLVAALILAVTSKYSLAIGIVYGGVPAVLAACTMTDALQRVARRR
jgi:hypothetical protein